jgi:hypothetical protein
MKRKAKLSTERKEKKTENVPSRGSKNRKSGLLRSASKRTFASRLETPLVSENNYLTGILLERERWEKTVQQSSWHLNNAPPSLAAAEKFMTPAVESKKS